MGNSPKFGLFDTRFCPTSYSFGVKHCLEGYLTDFRIIRLVERKKYSLYENAHNENSLKLQHNLVLQNYSLGGTTSNFGYGNYSSSRSNF